MSNKITKKITGYSVKTTENPEIEVPVPETAPVGISPEWRRPDRLPSTTYKIAKCQNTPNAAVYITISDAEIDGKLYPAEVFINTQDVTHQQWTVALTRTISAMFRHGGDCSFIAEELIAVHDPKGGCFQEGRFHPSLVSQVGRVLKEHLDGVKVETYAKAYGASETTASSLKDSLQDYFAVDFSELERKLASVENPNDPEGNTDFPPTSTLCPKCMFKAVVIMDGCQTCLSCGDSKCG